MKNFILIALLFTQNLFAYDLSNQKLNVGETKCQDFPELEKFVIKYNREKVIHRARSEVFAESAESLIKWKNQAQGVAISSTSLMIISGIAVSALGASYKAGGLAIFKGAQFIFPTKTFLTFAPLSVSYDLGKVYLVIRYSAGGAMGGMKLFKNLSAEQVEKFQEMKSEIYELDKRTIVENLESFDVRVKNYRNLLYGQIKELEQEKLEEKISMRIKTLGWSVYANIKIDHMVAEKLTYIHSELSDIYQTIQSELEEICAAESESEVI